MNARRILDPSRLPITLLGALLLVFLVAPLVGLVANLSGTDLGHTYDDPQTRSAVLTSLVTASVSTLGTAVLGVPLGYMLARFQFPGRTLANVAVLLPLVLPPVSAGILLILLYGPYGVIGGLLSPHGIQIVDTASGIVLAQMFVSAPFVVVSARAAFSRIDPEYEEVAVSMGANTWQIFTRVSLPLARAGIAAGLALGWMRSLGEFGATVIVAYHPYSLPVLNYVDLNSVGLQTALPLALLAVVVAGVVLLVLFALGQLRLENPPSRLL